MPSEVFFANLRSRTAKQSKSMKVKALFEKAGFSKIVTPEDLVAVKLHFGEAGGDTYINPIFVRVAVDLVKEAGGKPFLTDTNTLYSGSRHNGVDHLATASSHGFVSEVVGAPVIIGDGLMGENRRDVSLDGKGKYFEKAHIAGAIVEADGMVVLSHFKGHGMAGFGGAIKNLAMGCAPAAGKKDQHFTRISVNEGKCVGCGECIEICPVKALSFIETEKGRKATSDKEVCIGCGECITVCPMKALAMDWEEAGKEFLERMGEYAWAAVKDKKEKVCYINFLLNITPDCDCVPWSDTPVVPDIGILASWDPIALDQACYDLVTAQEGFKNSLLECNHKAGEDKFVGLGRVDGRFQLQHGAQLGMGNLEYKLIEI